jgi:hypothetical protein
MRAGALTEGYGGERPVGGYMVLSSVFAAALAGGLVAGRLPERLETRDLVLGGIATHKLSRLITKDKVTGFLRAPFTHFQEASGHGEVEEEPRGEGLRYSFGELLVCPYCMGQWVAGALLVGYVHAPRTTRMIAGLATMHAVADVLQLAYKAAEEKA